MEQAEQAHRKIGLCCGDTHDGREGSPCGICERVPEDRDRGTEKEAPRICPGMETPEPGEGPGRPYSLLEQESTGAAELKQQAGTIAPGKDQKANE